MDTFNGAEVMTMRAEDRNARQVQQAFASMGTNLLLILPGSTTAGGYRGGFGSQPTLTWDDLKAIQAVTECGALMYVIQFPESVGVGGYGSGGPSIGMPPTFPGSGGRRSRF